MIKKWLAKFIFSGVKNIEKYGSITVKDGDILFVEMGRHLDQQHVSMAHKNIVDRLKAFDIRASVMAYRENDIKSVFKIATR